MGSQRRAVLAAVLAASLGTQGVRADLSGSLAPVEESVNSPLASSDHAPALLLTTGVVSADPIGPAGWPPPFSLDFSTSGSANPGMGTGINYNYSNIDFGYGGGIAQLWWGPRANSVGISLNDNPANYTGSEILTLVGGYTSTTAQWTGSSSLTWWTGSQWVTDSSVSTRYTVTLSGLANWTSPAAGTAGDDGVVALVTGDYTANLLAEAYMPTDNSGGPYAWAPIADGFGNLNTDPSAIAGSTIWGDFWYEPVPAPGAALLGVLGLGMVGRIKRRFG